MVDAGRAEREKTARYTNISREATSMRYRQEFCQRCGAHMIASIMSWFTTETICMQCSEKEREIKRKLRSQGIEDALEGCGYIPSVD
jgi:hypothetical protein